MLHVTTTVGFWLKYLTVYFTTSTFQLLPLDQMAPLSWMAKIEPQDLTSTQDKIKKNSTGDRDKRQKKVKYIRKRARLPQNEDELKHYKLPTWVGHDNFKQMLLQMLKSLSNTQQRLRILESVVADNFLVPSDKSPVIVGVAMADAYHKKAVNSSDDMGAPGPQICFVYCEELVKCDIGEEQKRLVKENILNKMEALPQHRATEIVSVFNIRPCHDPDFHKIVLVSQDPLTRSSFQAAMKSLSGVKHYTAPAPASGQEDEIQKWIEMLETL